MAIQSGAYNLGFGYFGIYDVDWNLLATTGTRQYTKDVTFPTSFGTVPEVILMLKGFHIQKGESSRLALGISAVTTDGFTIAISTWDDTSVVGCGINWLAYDI